MFFGRGWSGAAAVHGRCVWLCCHTLLTFKFYKLNPESSVLFSFSWFREVWTLQSWRLLDSPLLCGATYAGGYGDCDLQLETRLGGENFIVPQYFFLASLAAFSRWAATCPLLLNVVIDPFLVLDNRESPVETFTREASISEVTIFTIGCFLQSRWIPWGAWDVRLAISFGNFSYINWHHPLFSMCIKNLNTVQQALSVFYLLSPL